MIEKLWLTVYGQDETGHDRHNPLEVKINEIIEEVNKIRDLLEKGKE